MLIFFWNATGTIKTGNLTSMTWCCQGGNVSYCLCTTDGGIDIINPYWDANCYSFPLNFSCTTIDYFDNKILFGTQSSGIYTFPWSVIQTMETGVEVPDVSYSFLDTASGIKSNNILKINSNENYLTFLTPSGLEWLKAGEVSTIPYSDELVEDVYVKSDGTTYLATENTLKVKDGEPIDFSLWDYIYTVSGIISNVWVNELTNTIFLSTSSGAVVFKDLRGLEEYKYVNTFSYYPHLPTYTGIVGTNFIATESDTSYDWGHLFTTTSNSVFDIDLKLNQIMQIFEISSDIVDLKFPRLWTR